MAPLCAVVYGKKACCLCGAAVVRSRKSLLLKTRKLVRCADVGVSLPVSCGNVSESLPVSSANAV